MINVSLRERDENILICCQGHARFAPKGRDIVCAGVSALCMGLEGALKGIFGDSIVLRAEDGLMRAEFPYSSRDDVGGEIRGAVNTFVAGVSRIARLYPRHVCVEKDCFPLWVRYIDTSEQTTEKMRGGSI